ncbi:MAG TPA: DUF1572 family protein [Chryseolinea sp.]|nr:DUF1572 family protein [Chryseolinea sp.]
MRGIIQNQVILPVKYYYMLNGALVNFYERDIRKLIEEVNLFKNEENLWKTHGSVKNSSGNLVLHIIGGTNHLIGATLAHTGYVRDRDEEFVKKGVPRKDLVGQLEKLIPLINKTVGALDIEADYPLIFDDATRSNSYVLTQLLLHLNYHLGQVNYLRRILE